MAQAANKAPVQQFFPDLGRAGNQLHPYHQALAPHIPDLVTHGRNAGHG